MSTGPQFFQTRMGTRFYEADVPRIATALERIAAALEARTPRAPETIPEQKQTLLTCQECGIVMDGYWSKLGAKLCEPCAKTHITVVGIGAAPEQKTGENLCCDDPGCAEKPRTGFFTCMTCAKKTDGEPVWVPVTDETRIGLCTPCAKIVNQFRMIVEINEREEQA